MNSSPNPVVQMSVGHKAQESKVRCQRADTLWMAPPSQVGLLPGLEGRGCRGPATDVSFFYFL